MAIWERERVDNCTTEKAKNDEKNVVSECFGFRYVENERRIHFL